MKELNNIWKVDYKSWLWSDYLGLKIKIKNFVVCIVVYKLCVCEYNCKIIFFV